jgi:CHAT domain-containing protein/tetratricopeptide (TPR) repeat protein
VTFVKDDNAPLAEAQTLGDKSNPDIILTYYPFHHKLTYSADSLYLHYSNEEALSQYLKANQYFISKDNVEGIAYTYNMIAEIYTNRLRDLQLAEKTLIKAERIINEQLGENHPLISDTYLTYGSYCSLKGGMAQEAYKYLVESRRIRSGYYGMRSIQVAEANYRLGQTFQHDLSEFENAKNSYNRAFITFKEFLPSSHPDLIKSYFALGSIYNYIQDYQRAIINLDQANYYYSQDSISNMIGLTRTLNIKANVLNNSKRYDLSISYYETVIKLFKELQGPMSMNLIYPYAGIGVAYLRTGEYLQAIEYLDQSLEVYNYFFSDTEPLDIYAVILENKGECYTGLRKIDSAKFYHHAFKDYDSALFYSQKALIVLSADFDSMDISQNPTVRGNKYLTQLFDLFAVKAKILVDKSKSSPEEINLLNSALQINKSLDQLSDRLRSSDFDEESKLISSYDIHQIFGSAIKCSFQLYQKTLNEIYLEEALNFFEKNKYMLLFQDLELARKSNELDIPFHYRFRNDSLQALKAEIKHKIDNSDPQTLNELSDDAFIVDQAILELRKEIEKEYPNFYKVDYDEMTVDLEQLKDYARKSQSLLIEYYVGDSSINVLSIGPSEVKIHEIQRTKKLNNVINDYLRLISTNNQNENIQENYESYLSTSILIYNEILYPILEKHESTDLEQIIIAPDGILAQVPFEALISNLPESDFPDYSKLDYLVYSFKFSYVYSFNLFVKNLEKEKDKNNNVLAFSYSSIEVMDNPEKRSNDIIELPGTIREIESIKKILKGKNLFLENEAATETEFKKRSTNYEILHLAVHGIGDFESSINSKLVFKNQKDSLNDGNLFLYELQNIDLNNSNLAILSACETGIGKEFRGEGVFSIARGFASAGCPSIIMSLWKVNDMVSADIMSALYKNLKKGEKLNEALRNSKITYINQSDPLMSHPANWAAFVPLGQVNAIYDRKLNPFIIGIIFLIVIIPIIFLIHRKLQKKV